MPGTNFSVTRSHYHIRAAPRVGKPTLTSTNAQGGRVGHSVSTIVGVRKAQMSRFNSVALRRSFSSWKSLLGERRLRSISDNHVRQGLLAICNGSVSQSRATLLSASDLSRPRTPPRVLPLTDNPPDSSAQQRQHSVSPDGARSARPRVPPIDIPRSNLTRVRALLAPETTHSPPATAHPPTITLAARSVACSTAVVDPTVSPRPGIGVDSIWFPKVTVPGSPSKGKGYCFEPRRNEVKPQGASGWQFLISRDLPISASLRADADSRPTEEPSVMV
eukprot:gnl/TRDRNA2_/TRDRNA2_122927_c1_seq1.p1 gnl/TRDRNA2_/TRDRNA2_122927_c1~~gnl/TRDRNA2_/TRDRNA2_122927_c1_seq1.p1  ORF type:complete len:283 (-),score=-3.89 gnl/TRDRNA2_/TRDRNA2_122927_c1_seq1:108-935(-)